MIRPDHPAKAALRLFLFSNSPAAFQCREASSLDISEEQNNMITLLTAAHFAHIIFGSEPQNPKMKFGKYQFELRMPDGGLFAQEQTDVEFRVVDTTQKDPVEEGFKGVGAIDASGSITMPAMIGMPTVKPEIHREGVPGDYGMVLFFAHGGEYQIDLDLKIPNDGTKHIKFVVSVNDERLHATKTVAPYQLKLIQNSKLPMAGIPTPLSLQIIDSKSKKVQTSFDTAHERKFHLLIASKDLNWFRHEHPTMDANGTWKINQTFPAGTTYLVYADVAPSGKGSRILMSKLVVGGPKPKWNTKLTLNSIGTDQGLRGNFGSEKLIRMGQTSTVVIKLTDAKTKTPTGITENYLGAVGHLMIFSQDGMTAVHSHPAEDADSLAQAKSGIVKFNARFPKSGLYKAYAQFQWHGSVKTLGFTIEVKK